MLKAIETQYKGYRFRSRLEARWAVFFDSLEFTWTYEQLVVAVQGDPWPQEYFLTTIVPESWDAEYIYGIDVGEFGRCRACDRIHMIASEDSENGYAHYGLEKCQGLPKCGERWPIGSEYSPRLKHAFARARGARFEHGESPR